MWIDKKILIVVPAFNEEANIGATVKEILAHNKNLIVAVVNDGSKDRTAMIAKEAGAKVLSLPFNLGIGGAVQTGFKFALINDFDILAQVDGDGQHDILYIEKLLQPICEDKADMTIGSRFLPPFLGYQSSFVRRIGINFFAVLLSFLTGHKVTDPTSGFRAYNRKMIKVFAKHYPQDFPEPEAVVIADHFRARILEVPVQMRKRSAGNSSIRYLKTLYYMVKVTVAILLDKIKKF